MATITALETTDVRFPTSLQLDGSDAMNPDPDYSTAYVIIRTDDPDGHEGHGFCFTIGRGTEVVVAAIDAFAPYVLGRDVEALCADLGGFARELAADSQLRWLGPEKGVTHMATAAILNGLWDLRAKRRGKPLWQLLSELDPEEIVDLIDFRHITDALTPSEALELLRSRVDTRAERIAHLREHGYPAYATSPGWLGYSEEKMQRLCAEALEDGFRHVKLKVGADIEQDVRRLRLAREALGPDIALMIDANQRWEVGEAIEHTRQLAAFDPWWVEEPTSPDDILGHVDIARAIAPIPVAAGEHVQNRVIFKQMLRSGAIGVCQIDTCRLAGVNEVIAVLLLAAKFGVRVCPHAGGVGLCELAQHMAMFDYIAVSGSLDDRVLEFVDHLHEHFVNPVDVRDGAYRVPTAPGYSSEIKRDSLAAYAYPHGEAWDGLLAEAPA